MTGARSGKIGALKRLRVHVTTLLKHIITPANRFLLMISNGCLGNSFLGVPVLSLTTVGAKSKLERVTPLFYLHHQGKIILVASNGGNTKNPAWVANINAHPEVKVKIKGQETRMHAHIATAEERQRYWPMVTELFPTWKTVQETSVRTFPIAVLEPRRAV
ncbi:MAG: nitroreductase/quinone reductase family protein [Candidatus Binatia bacterium]